MGSLGCSGRCSAVKQVRLAARPAQGGPSFAAWLLLLLLRHRRALGIAAGPRLIAVLFAHQWNPAAMHTVLALEELRLHSELNFAQTFVVDAEVDADAAADHGMRMSPALVLFWDGEKVQFRRQGWDDDDKRACPPPLRLLLRND